MQNGTHFELFSLPARFEVDRQALDHAYRTVQAQVHPDRFAAAGDAQKRIAMQWATRVNEAYRTLREPLPRATYLLHLRGLDVKADDNTAMAPAFLMQQLEWREQIDAAAEARDAAALEALLDTLRADERSRYTQLAGLLGAGADAAAADAVRQLMFVDRLVREIDRQLERLEEAG